MTITHTLKVACLCVLASQAMAQGTPDSPQDRPGTSDSTAGHTGANSAGATSSAATSSGRMHDNGEMSDSSGQTKGNLSSEDFVKKAAKSGQAEVAMGNLGVQKASNAQVKAFAQRMVTDHTKANQELATTAAPQGFKVPDEPGMTDRLMGEKFKMHKQGKDFDQDYMKEMVKDHQTDIALFEQAQNAPGVDPTLQALARKTLPVLRSHLKEAQSIQSQLGTDSTGEK